MSDLDMFFAEFSTCRQRIMWLILANAPVWLIGVAVEYSERLEAKMWEQIWREVYGAQGET